MTKMKTFTPEDLDPEVLLDVEDEVEVLCEESASTLLLLGNEPNNKELLNQLFRSVHTIKGDVCLAQFTPLIPLVSAIEDILAMLRESTIEYDDLISKVLLTIVDYVKGFVDDCANLGNTAYDSEVFILAAELMSKITSNNIEQHRALLAKSLYILEPSLVNQNNSELFTQELDDVRIDWSSDIESDLVFFHSIMKPIEERIDHWEGRSSRQLKLALLLNQFSGKVVDEHQLRTAVYLHDLGMSLLPLALLHRTNTLLESDVIRLRSHVQYSVDFLSEMPHWDEARQFIYEHHERPDGKGYPNGLNNDEISHGAKILAIVDAFEAMTHVRAQQVHLKRHISNALQEINSASGSQFCPYWVDILNKVMASILDK